MKILISSHSFYPSIGGIESSSLMLATEFVALGHQVNLITQTPSEQVNNFPFELTRQPKPRLLLDLVHWCDVFFHNNISLQTSWPLLLIHKPWVIAHHTWITRTDGSLGWQDIFKKSLTRFATNISISKAIGEHLSSPSVIIGNPYLDRLFYEIPNSDRHIELVYLGRLVSDKGVDILFQALQILKQWNLTPKLTVIGAGEEFANLQLLVQSLEIENQVSFVGVKTGLELNQLLNAHQIMVVPSRWAEPFSIVALEAIACGCVVVGSEDGGLKDAIGPCGVTFPNGDAHALAKKLADLLLDQNRLESFRREAKEHLSNHQSRSVALKYLKVIQEQVK